MTKELTFRIFTDSISSNSWINGSQSSYVSHLIRPLKGVIESKITLASFDVSTSNLVYIRCEELSSAQFNECGGLPNAQGFIATEPSTKAVLGNAMLPVPVDTTGRTVVKEYDYDTTTRYLYPIKKLDRLTIHLHDENGNPATVNSNTFITFNFRCDVMSPRFLDL